MYTLKVSENSAYMDPDSPSALRGEFSTWEAAVAAAKHIVDRSLNELVCIGMLAEDLFHQYTLFGEDAYIIPVPEGKAFSAWEYARERARELCDDVV